MSLSQPLGISQLFPIVLETMMKQNSNTKNPPSKATIELDKVFPRHLRVGIVRDTSYRTGKVLMKAGRHTINQRIP